MNAPADPLVEPVLARERLLSGSYLTVERWTVRQPDGREAPRELVSLRDAVAVLPCFSDGTVQLIRQHRPAIGRTLLEVPAGLMESGEEPLAAARRELLEETGLTAGRMDLLLRYAQAEGFATNFLFLFLARELTDSGHRHLDEGEFIEPVRLPFADLLRQVQEAKILDAKTILCALYGAKELDRARA